MRSAFDALPGEIWLLLLSYLNCTDLRHVSLARWPAADGWVRLDLARRLPRLTFDECAASDDLYGYAMAVARRHTRWQWTQLRSLVCANAPRVLAFMVTRMPAMHAAAPSLHFEWFFVLVRRVVALNRMTMLVWLMQFAERADRADSAGNQWRRALAEAVVTSRCARSLWLMCRLMSLRDAVLADRVLHAAVGNRGTAMTVTFPNRLLPAVVENDGEVNWNFFDERAVCRLKTAAEEADGGRDWDRDGLVLALRARHAFAPVTPAFVGALFPHRPAAEHRLICYRFALRRTS